MTANAEAMPMPMEVPVERLWLEASGVGVGGVIIVVDIAVGRVDVVAEAEAAAGEVCDCEMVGADVAAPLLVGEPAVDVADHVTTEGPGVLIYWKESVFPVVALTNEKW